MAALQAAQLDEGPADEARDRVVSAAWQHLASYGAMVQAVADPPARNGAPVRVPAGVTA